MGANAGLYVYMILHENTFVFFGSNTGKNPFNIPTIVDTDKQTQQLVDLPTHERKNHQVLYIQM